MCIWIFSSLFISKWLEKHNNCWYSEEQWNENCFIEENLRVLNCQQKTRKSFINVYHAISRLSYTNFDGKLQEEKS